mmetsp:Transcript_11837/g.33414  ORF Transcript_11837/g.33414 Transcript_11837/m.33414 type:complete len:209 (+) Transcript_11837:1735-2361(+)
MLSIRRGGALCRLKGRAQQPLSFIVLCPQLQQEGQSCLGCDDLPVVGVVLVHTRPDGKHPPVEALRLVVSTNTLQQPAEVAKARGELGALGSELFLTDLNHTAVESLRLLVVAHGVLQSGDVVEALSDGGVVWPEGRLPYLQRLHVGLFRLLVEALALEADRQVVEAGGHKQVALAQRLAADLEGHAVQRDGLIQLGFGAHDASVLVQ